ncbi:MAG: carboxypeptidase M32 [Oscillospiraceae bacterium]|nr:carboxypeptidase M32 [Oscillospiraceae bacterium]
MTIKEAIEKLNDLERREFALHHAMGILDYDGNTVAPKLSYEPRGVTMGILAEEEYKLATGREARDVLDFLKNRTVELGETVRRRIELREKDLKEMESLSMAEYAGFATLMNEASAVWHEAKEKSDYALFAPYLEKVIDYTKLFAARVAPEKAPYDYCLDKYEEGLDSKTCDAFFSALRQRIVPLVEKVKASRQPDDAVSKVYFPVHKQRMLSDRVMAIMGLDRDRCTIGETEHPFTTDFTRNDVRITTKYKENSFLSSLYSVVHEGGHALYELGGDPAFSYTSLRGGVTMGIHESQSRFFENIIGRSRQFIELLYPDLTELCPEIGKWTAEDIFRAANRSEPSLIRTEADELTYPLHIMVRYEIEQQMINGSVNVRDLPEMWNELYRKYLGIVPSCDRDGILQDSHWSGAGIGYFPSYALGSAYGAQYLKRMEESFDFWGDVRSGDLEPIRQWLGERIWKYASLKKPAWILNNAMGEAFDPSCYLDYLEGKIKEVYGF